MANFSPMIGKIAGIDVQLHWTFILLLLFSLVISLPLFMIFVLLFLFVFLHELAHSITAKNNNIPVQKIILYPLGGGSVIDMDNIDPHLEFRISLAGPLSNFFFGFVLGAIVILMPGGFAKSIMQLLFLLNILLAASNIIPWFPLDGGRILRSYLQRKRSFFTSTEITVKASNVITILFILGTFIFVYLSNGYSLLYKETIVIFDLFIAIFFYGGAQAEMQSAYVRNYTSDLPLSAVTSKNYIMLKPSVKMGSLYNEMLAHHTHLVIFKQGNEFRLVSHLPTVISNKGVGNLIKKDIAYFSSPLPVISYNAKPFQALTKMQIYDSGIIGIVKSGKLIGIIQRQHLESVLSLHISKSSKLSKGQKRQGNEGV